jgi:hypothetical protein
MDEQSSCCVAQYAQQGSNESVTSENDKAAPRDCPGWLDQVMGPAAPPFSFRKGGSAITGGADAQRSGSTAAANPRKGGQRG